MTIGQVAELLNISTYTIRFYEKQGLIHVPRNDKGVRVFDNQSIEALKAILHYRNVGMSLEDIRRVFDNFHDHDLSVQLLKSTKKGLDTRIAELEMTREYLIYKIKLHERIALEEKAEVADNQIEE